MIKVLHANVSHERDYQDSGTRDFSKKSAIAALLAQEISQMSSEELLSTIETASSLLQGRTFHAELECADRPVLEMLVRQARRSCRNQGY